LLCASSSLPQGSDLLREHLRTEVLRSGYLLHPEGLRPGDLRPGRLRPGHLLLYLRAEDLLPEALQASSDLPAEHLRAEVLLCSGFDLRAEVLRADVLLSRAVLPREVLPRAALPQGPQVLLREHLLCTSRSLLWRDRRNDRRNPARDPESESTDPREEHLVSSS
jgi:hypothetical protein